MWRGAEEGLPVVIVNPCLILGPGNWNDSSLSIFKTASKGILFYPKGSNAIVDVRDLVSNMIYLMNSTITNKKFLCTGQNVSFLELLSAIASCFNKRPPRMKTPRLISLIFAAFSEVFYLFLRKRRGLTIESVYSAYKTIRYDSRLISTTTGIPFTPLNDTLLHAIKGRII